MKNYSLIFLVLAISTALLGFTATKGSAMENGKVLSFVYIFISGLCFFWQKSAAVKIA